MVGYEILTTKALRVVSGNTNDALDLSKIESIIVTDRHSQGQRSYRGYSFGAGRGSGVRMSMGSGGGSSKPVGDLSFFDSEFGIVYVLNDVPDPQGVKNLVKAAQPHIK